MRIKYKLYKDKNGFPRAKAVINGNEIVANSGSQLIKKICTLYHHTPCN
jgi:hypothetical protein